MSVGRAGDGLEQRRAHLDGGPPGLAIEDEPGIRRQASHACIPGDFGSERPRRQQPRDGAAIDPKVAQQRHDGALRRRHDQALVVAGVPQRSRRGHVGQQLGAGIGVPDQHVGPVGGIRADVPPGPGLTDDPAQQHAARHQAYALLRRVDDDPAKVLGVDDRSRTRRDVVGRQPRRDPQELLPCRQPARLILTHAFEDEIRHAPSCRKSRHCRVRLKAMSTVLTGGPARGLAARRRRQRDRDETFREVALDLDHGGRHELAQRGRGRRRRRPRRAHRSQVPRRRSRGSTPCAPAPAGCRAPLGASRASERRRSACHPRSAGRGRHSRRSARD